MGVLRRILLFILVLSSNIACFPLVSVYLIILRPILYINPVLYGTISGRLACWAYAVIATWLDVSGYRISECGDDVTECLWDEALVIANHQSTGDVPVLMHSLYTRGRSSDNVYWVLADMFKPTHFGVGSMLRGDFFIKEGQKHRLTQPVKLKKHLLDTYLSLGRKWIMLFPEGGFFYKRKETSQRYARKNGFPVLEHVSLPRLGAVQAVLEALSPQSAGHTEPGQHPIRPLKWLIDITIGYPPRPLDLTHITMGGRPPCDTVLHYRKYPASDLPTGDTALRDWLFQRYQEKDQLLAHFYETGSFPEHTDLKSGDEEINGNVPVNGVITHTSRSKTKLITHNPVYLVAFNLFFIISFCFFAYIAACSVRFCRVHMFDILS